MIAVTRALSAELTSERARAAAGCLLRRGSRTTSRCCGQHACRAFMEAEHPDPRVLLDSLEPVHSMICAWLIMTFICFISIVFNNRDL